MLSVSQIFRNITKKRRREHSEPSQHGSSIKDEKHQASETQIHHVLSKPSGPKALAPRLELPMDFYENSFSKATYSPPSSPETPKLRRIKAMDELSPPAFRLMDLPSELRLNVLNMYFGCKTMAVDLDGTKAYKKQFFCLAHQQRRLNITPLLQTCRRLNKEASAVLWNTTTFVIRIAGPLSRPRQLLPSIPLAMMRHVVLHIGLISEILPSEFRKLLLSFQSLQIADVHFDFTESRFRQAVFGDWVVEEVAEGLKTEKFGRVSCVSLERNEDDEWDSSQSHAKSVVPYQCKALEKLKARSHAYVLHHGHNKLWQMQELTNRVQERFLIR